MCHSSDGSNCKIINNDTISEEKDIEKDLNL